jgi:hypothetical protein
LVFCDCTVAAQHHLVADLALDGVVVHLLRLVPAVEVVAVGGSLLMVEVHENIRRTTRTADARLRIAAVCAVDLLPDKRFSGLHRPSWRSHGAIVSRFADMLGAVQGQKGA